MTTADFATVFHGDSLMEAEMIKGLLEGEGILCRIPGELSAEPNVAAHQVMGGRQLDVMVSTNDVEQARGVIRQAIEDGKRLQGFLADHPDENPG